jgi:hypothetical protein
MQDTRAPRESDLYAPVKAYLETLGYQVRGEVGPCDIVAVRDEAVIAVELKLGFGLAVLYQALDRIPAVDLVYVGVAVPEGRRAAANWDAQRRDAVRLCRLIGLGLLAVRGGTVEVLADPAPYVPRKQAAKRAKLLGEFGRRSGDHNVGGTTRRPRMTAYREDALACAAVLAASGAMQGAAVRDATGVAKATAVMRANVYGWFERAERGRYAVSDAGRAALAAYADVLAARAGSAAGARAGSAARGAGAGSAAGAAGSVSGRTGTAPDRTSARSGPLSP